MEKVWRLCRLARRYGMQIEITTLVIPTVNDSDEILQGIASHIASDLEPATPWHVSAYFPAYRFNAPPTPLLTLERAWKIGRETGLEFVYAGNVPSHPYDNTRCPGYNTLLIQWIGFHVSENRIRSGCCPECKREIVGVWETGKPWDSAMW